MSEEDYKKMDCAMGHKELLMAQGMILGRLERMGKDLTQKIEKDPISTTTVGEEQDDESKEEIEEHLKKIEGNLKDRGIILT